jgi:hypothetical protein
MGRHRKDEYEEPRLLSPEELEAWENTHQARMEHLTELYQQARRDGEQERARELWEWWQYFKQHERVFYALQRELRRQADEAAEAAARKTRLSRIK